MVVIIDSTSGIGIGISIGIGIGIDIAIVAIGVDTAIGPSFWAIRGRGIGFLLISWATYHGQCPMETNPYNEKGRSSGLK